LSVIAVPEIEVAMPARALTSAILLLVSAAAPAQTAQPRWIADSRIGCRVWNAVPQPKESITWSGACQNGLAQGRGILQRYQDNKPSERYEGEYRDGKENGRGVYVWASDNRYEGEWRDGKAHGFGRMARANGDVYNGIWANGCFRDGNRWWSVGVDAASCH